MPFPELEVYKRQDREVASLLTSLEAYLNEVLHRPPMDLKRFFRSATHDINPNLVANELEISKARAQALLYMCYRAGIIIPRYDVYCPETGNYIVSFRSAEELPLSVACDFHELETEHRIDESPVEVLFEFNPRVVQDELKIAV